MATQKDLSLPPDLVSKIEIFRSESKLAIKEKETLLLKALIKNFSTFMKSAQWDVSGLTLNIGILHHVAVSFWHDIIRLQAYHPIEIPDHHKKAAFLFKWISKFKPVQVANLYDKNPETSKIYMRINELFSFFCVWPLLNCGKTPDQTVFDAIIYSATFRDIIPEQWSILFCLLEETCLTTTTS